MNANVLIVIASLLLIMLIISEKLLKKKIVKELEGCIYRGDFEQYNKIRNNRITKYLFYPFNLAFCDLNMSLARGNISQTEKCIKKFDSIRMSKKQKEIVYAKVFYYYVLIKNKKDAKRYYNLLKDLENENIMNEINIFYDTFIENGYKYIEITENMLSNLADEQKSDMEAILSKMYENKGDNKNALKYKKLSEEHFVLLKKRQVDLQY